MIIVELLVTVWARDTDYNETVWARDTDYNETVWARG